MKKKTFKTFLDDNAHNVKKKFKLKKIKSKKRKARDNKFGTRKNEGGLPGYYYGGLNFSDFSTSADVADGGSIGDGGGIGESVSYADESNLGSDPNFTIDFNNNGVDNDDVDNDDVDNDDVNTQNQEDSNKMGLIRKVKSAHLVFKRLTSDGTYEELWIYNINTNFKNELDVKNNILAGTDIPQNKLTSPDGTQQYNLWTMGNAQLLHIIGLPN